LRDGERAYREAQAAELLALPHLSDEPDVDLSVIVPAYNEVDRLAVMLDDCFAHLDTRPGLSLEVLVVDDGSRDGTADAAVRYAEKRQLRPGLRLRVVTLARNRGKGAAVTHVRRDQAKLAG
jgi:dolichyl-phosphate beta-glucosyltransferase